MRLVKILLAATILSAGSVPLASFEALAAPAVTGTSGCVLKSGRQPFQPSGNDGGSGGGGGNPGTPQIIPSCDGGNVGNYENPFQGGNFADTGSVNNAISNLQGQINTLAGAGPASVKTDGATIVGDGTPGNPIKLSDGIKNTIDNHSNQINNINNVNNRQDATLNDHEKRITDNTNKNIEQDNRLNGIDSKNAAQDATLNDHEKRITDNTNKNIEQDNRLNGIDVKNAAQDATLGDHEKRITKNEGDISGIQDGAVFYNRDGAGKKTGGVTLNDGTGSPVKLGNVAAGSQKTDGVNVGQLTSALDGLGGGSKVNPDGSVTGPTYNIGGSTYTNVGDALKATNQLSVQYVPDANGKPTNTVQLAGDGTGKPVKMTNLAAGTADRDAVNYGQVKNNISYNTNADGSRGNSITLTGGATGPVLMSNLADGIANNDAANVGQVKKAKTESFKYTDDKVAELKEYTDNRLGNLSGDIRSVQREARSGIASATAMAGLRYDDRPGKGSIAAGMGGFKSATSFATGVGYTSEDGRIRVNGSLGYGFEDSSLSWNAGASWTFN